MDVHVWIEKIETGIFHKRYSTKISIRLAYEDGIHIEQEVYIDKLFQNGWVDVSDFVENRLSKYINGKIIVH